MILERCARSRRQAPSPERRREIGPVVAVALDRAFVLAQAWTPSSRSRPDHALLQRAWQRRSGLPVGAMPDRDVAIDLGDALATSGSAEDSAIRWS
jgi:hypothetical protein